MLKHITIPDEVADAVFKGLKEIHKEQGVDMETNKKILRKRIDKIDKSIKEAFESGMHKFSQGLQKSIEEWEIERRKLIIEEQEMLKTTKTFFEQSNQLLEFCKNCHNAFLKGNAEMRRKIIQIVCSNFSYDGENIMIEPNPVFKTIIKNSLSNKKLLENGLSRTICIDLYKVLNSTSSDIFYRIQGYNYYITNNISA